MQEGYAWMESMKKENSQKEGLQRRFVDESGLGKCQGIC